jgi:hypothetical protein
LVDRWLLVDEMISELGGVFALEIEAAAFPELASDPLLDRVRLTILRASDAVARVAAIRGADGERFEQAREALDAALDAASSARAAVVRARSERNRSA